MATYGHKGFRLRPLRKATIGRPNSSAIGNPLVIDEVSIMMIGRPHSGCRHRHVTTNCLRRLQALQTWAEHVGTLFNWFVHANR